MADSSNEREIADCPDEREIIVCVESNPDSRDMVCRVLEATGRYRIYPAADALTALELMRQHGPALTLVDLDLPVVDGFEFIRRVRADEALKHHRVMAVSASVMKNERQRSVRAGFISFVEKPFDIHQFREEVVDCITKNRART